MAELVFHTGPMDCGKSTLALQMDYTQSRHGRQGRLFTKKDRSGRPAVTSRLGLSSEAFEVEDDFNFWTFVIRELTHAKRIDYLICDEAQFYLSEQIDQLARIVDELQIDVYAFGILADFRTKLFPGSQRLIVLVRQQGHPQCPHRRRKNGDGRVTGRGGGHRRRGRAGHSLRGVVQDASPSEGDQGDGAGYALARTAAVRQRFLELIASRSVATCPSTS